MSELCSVCHHSKPYCHCDEEVVDVAVSTAWEQLKDCSDEQRTNFLYKLKDEFCFECGSTICNGNCINDE